MRYTPHTALDQEQMLGALGLSRIEELYEHIPRPLQERGGMALPPGLSEVGVKKKMASLAAKNATAEDWHFFLGGGIYQHAIPSAVDAVIKRNDEAKKDLELERLRMSLRENVLTREVKANGFGSIDMERLDKSIDQMTTQKTVAAANVDLFIS